MLHDNEKNVSTDKLVNFLNKIGQGSIKGIDESYFDKLLTSIIHETSVKKVSLQPVLSWLENNTQRWPQITQDVTIASFLIKLTGILIRDEENFEILEKNGAVDIILSQDLPNNKNSTIRCSFFAVLCDLNDHTKGRDWLRRQSMWKSAASLVVSDSSMYVRRQARIFLKSVFKTEKQNTCFTKEILEDLLKPLFFTLEHSPTALSEDVAEKKLVPYLKLVDDLVDDNIAAEAANALPCLLSNEFKLDGLLLKWIEVVTTESFLEALVATYCTVLLSALTNDQTGDVQDIHNLFHILLKRKEASVIFAMNRVCHKIIVRMRSWRLNADPAIERHFFNMHLMAMFSTMTKKKFTFYLDHFIVKLFNQLSEETLRMAYNLRDIIKKDDFDKLVQRALTAIHSLMEYHTLMDRELVIIIFQSLTWVLKEFVPASCEDDEEDADDAMIQETRQLCMSAAPLLNALLQALCTLMHGFRITWNEAVEGLAHLKLCTFLLNTPLATKEVVLTLRLTRLTIAQCMPPVLALLSNNIEGSYVEVIGPLLVNKLHDPAWEVRDSALEVVAVMADLALEKYPRFQNMLLSLKLCSIVVAMLEGDAEGYVRASALNAIMSMIPVQILWDQGLTPLRIISIVQNVIQNDSEAIVRREAAVFFIKIVQHHRLTRDSYEIITPTMMQVALEDLHWEVRRNAINFWSEMLETELGLIGMVDGVFPEVTFSRFTKKIVTLTEAEIKSSLQPFMARWSEMGVLNVLLTALLEDCDQEVSQQAGKVVSKLLGILKRYDMVPEDSSDGPRKRKCSPDRKLTRTFAPNTTDNPSQGSSKNSDEVIEGIVNSSDMKLLVGVLADETQEKTPAGKQSVETITPEQFINRVKDLDLLRTEDSDIADSLATLLDDVMALDREYDKDNVPDCY